MNESKRPRHWRSLRALEAGEALRDEARAEFPEGADQAPAALSRRRFLQLMGASVALAGMSGCRWPRETILPYAHRAPGQIPGETTSFATAMELGGVAQGVLATSFDGRPIKVDGNPQLGGTGGAASSMLQASVLELYDPDRSQHVLKNGEKSDWTAFDNFATEHFAELKATGGEGLAVLSELSSSPSMARERSAFLAEFPAAKWYDYEPLSRENVSAGLELAYGNRFRPRLDLDKAQVILSLDDDFLSDHPDAMSLNRAFARGRRVESGSMNRLYVLEPGFSITGGMADQRLSIRASGIHGFLLDLVDAIAGSGAHGDWAHNPFFEALRRDLASHRGKAVVTAGARQPAEVHALVALLNQELGAPGETLHYTEEILPPSGVAGIKRLSADISHGKVKTLLILGGNPAYDAPAEFEFAGKIESVPLSIRLGLKADETSALCSWHLPRSHYLESWGDALAWDGSYCTTQPLIEALYGGKSPQELLSLLRGEPLSGYEIAREALAARFPSADFEKLWRKTLHAGLVDGRRSDPLAPPPLAVGLRHRLSPPKDSEGLELVFAGDPKIYDGRFANNSWLQETPDPVTKLTWDNAAFMNSATAEKLDAKDEEMLKLVLDGREMTLPTMILPGLAEDTLIVNLGYGRKTAGRVGDDVGFDAYALRASSAMGFAGGLSVEKAGGKHTLAMTQDHWLIDEVGFNERARRIPIIAREGSKAEYDKDPHFATSHEHHPPLISLWEEHEYEGNRWGMAIDLNACTGCSACSVACQAENNIPVVGKDEVERGREMSWIRLDRYFSGDPEDPGMIQQPVACTHCEMAPCEQVCPVGATVHSDEGLNDMAYNRCIGTRYCANNCPFKVRRFNWFDWHKEIGETESLVYNPDVTVRGRGVMEKCSYCVQRIEGAKIAAKNEGRALADGDITPACAQTCPAEAIVFGDLNDEESRVRKMHDNARSYQLLGELNLKSRTAYMARVKNPNPELVEDSGEHGHH